MRAPAPHAQPSQYSFPVSLPMNWSTTPRHGKVSGLNSLHTPALFACKGKKVINNDGECHTDTCGAKTSDYFTDCKTAA